MSVYIPCDNYLETHVSSDYSEVDNAIESTPHELNCYTYILAGEFNKVDIK